MLNTNNAINKIMGRPLSKGIVRDKISRNQFKKNDVVVLKKEYRNSNENNETYTIIESNGDRIIIKPTKFGGSFAPTELVRSNMIEKA